MVRIVDRCTPGRKAGGVFLFAVSSARGDYDGHRAHRVPPAVLHRAVPVGGCRRCVGRCRKRAHAMADGHRPLSHARPSIAFHTPRSPWHHAVQASIRRRVVPPSIPRRRLLDPGSTTHRHFSDTFSDRVEPPRISLLARIHGIFPPLQPGAGTSVHPSGLRPILLFLFFFLLPLLFFFHSMRSRKERQARGGLGGVAGVSVALESGTVGAFRDRFLGPRCGSSEGIRHESSMCA